MFTRVPSFLWVWQHAESESSPLLTCPSGWMTPAAVTDKAPCLIVGLAFQLVTSVGGRPTHRPSSVSGSTEEQTGTGGAWDRCLPLPQLSQVLTETSRAGVRLFSKCDCASPPLTAWVCCIAVSQWAWLLWGDNLSLSFLLVWRCTLLLRENSPKHKRLPVRTCVHIYTLLPPAPQPLDVSRSTCSCHQVCHVLFCFNKTWKTQASWVGDVT